MADALQKKHDIRVRIVPSGTSIGRLLPLNWLRLLWWLHNPKARTFRVPLMGVVRRLQNTRLASQFVQGQRVERDQPVVGGDDGDLLPVEVGLGELVEHRPGRAAADAVLYLAGVNEPPPVRNERILPSYKASQYWDEKQWSWFDQNAPRLEAIFTAIAQKPKYVLDADIAKCFDQIDQMALLNKVNTSPGLRRGAGAGDGASATTPSRLRMVTSFETGSGCPVQPQWPEMVTPHGPFGPWGVTRMGQYDGWLGSIWLTQATTPPPTWTASS